MLLYSLAYSEGKLYSGLNVWLCVEVQSPIGNLRQGPDLLWNPSFGTTPRNFHHIRHRPGSFPLLRPIRAALTNIHYIPHYKNPKCMVYKYWKDWFWLCLGDISYYQLQYSILISFFLFLKVCLIELPSITHRIKQAGSEACKELHVTNYFHTTFVYGDITRIPYTRQLCSCFSLCWSGWMCFIDVFFVWWTDPDVCLSGSKQ